MRPYQAGDGRWLQFNMIRDEEMLSLLLAALDAIDLPQIALEISGYGLIGKPWATNYKPALAPKHRTSG